VQKNGSVVADSFYEGLLDYPHYTRPLNYEGLTVPEVLTQGNHQAIARWRREQALKRTHERRPDLLQAYVHQHGQTLAPWEKALLDKLGVSLSH
jgi:tRNA (guanine37-N1)-methyltransferase